MKYVAYHRTSTKEQHLDRGIAEITKYCADNAILMSLVVDISHQKTSH